LLTNHYELAHWGKKGENRKSRTDMVNTLIHKFFRQFGYDITRIRDPHEIFPPDITDEDIDIVRKVREFTMTSTERIHALIQAVRYVSINNIAGDIVECGVWKGGSMAAAARMLLRLKDCNRGLFLFDTFDGMSEPSANDVDFEGKEAAKLLQVDPTFKCDGAPIENVKRILAETGYPESKTHFVMGKVEETIPEKAPHSIALLRLDTDWYESTRHELVNLFPRLARGGVLIVDDYGHWRGARKACDEYFAENRIPVLLNRIDYTGRIAVKQ
jgi:hypothetical protein